ELAEFHKPGGADEAHPRLRPTLPWIPLSKLHARTVNLFNVERCSVHPLLMGAADHVQDRLALFFFDRFEGSFKRRQDLLWIIDFFAVAAMRFDNFFIAR